MPELPEVETVRSALAVHLPGRRFVRIETFVDALRFPLAPLHDPLLLGRAIIAVRRRGRYLLLELEEQRGLIIHLGMTGTIRITAPDEPRRKHEHVFFRLDDSRIVRFEDPRRFGFIQTCAIPCPGGEPSVFFRLGPEPLGDDFSPEYLFQALRGRKSRIKTVLMDNAIVVGVGNIYASESLFMSGLNPLKPAGLLSFGQCEKLVADIRHVLRCAIDSGGTTFSDFRNVDGSEGRFALRLNVYGKAGAPCGHCGTPIIRTVVGGRSSFHCPRCQPFEP